MKPWVFHACGSDGQIALILLLLSAKLELQATRCPGLIDLSNFIDWAEVAEARQTAASSSPARNKLKLNEIAATPPDVTSGTLEAERTKLRNVLEYAKVLEEEIPNPYNPVAGIQLVPARVVQPERRTTTTK